MNRPRLLDLFCGAGGAAMGYHRAGFEVVGVDIRPQPHYPFKFIKMDALRWLQHNAPIGFSAIHASPPCQRWLTVPRALGDEYPDLLTPVGYLLKASGLPYVIENVPTAPLGGPVLCGLTFGLPVVRHRRFETSFPMPPVPSLCPQMTYGRSVFHKGCYPFAHGAWRPAWRRFVMPALWPWMTLEETHDAIPPAYTEWIGKQLMAALKVAA